MFLLELFENRLSPLYHRREIFSFFLVFVSTVVFVLETIETMHVHLDILHRINLCVFFIFTLEYLLCFFAQRKKLRFLFSFYSLLDLLVIFSFFFLFWEMPFLRIFRVFILLKFVERSHLVRNFFRNFRYYREELKIFFVSFFLVLFMSSFAIYFAEHRVNEYIQSLGDALWWTVVTVFTVGYGDIVPITVLGKILGGFVSFFGVGTIAMLTALITKIFMDHFFGKGSHHCKVCHYPHHDYDAKYCKNCGSELNVALLQKQRQYAFFEEDQND